MKIRKILPAMNFAAEESIDPAADIAQTFGLNLGDKQDSETKEPETKEPKEQPKDPEPQPQPKETEPQEPEKKEPESNPEQHFADNKQQHAFAQMRIQNKQYADLLKNMAQVLGVQDTGNPDAMLQALNDKVTAAQAKQQGVPVEILRRLQTMEQESALYRQDQLRQRAYQGFQSIKDSYGLSNEELNKFADELAQKNINPFVNEVDVSALYSQFHQADIINKAVEKALAEERARVEHANNHSTNPEGRQGATDPDLKQINSIGELDAYLDSLK